MASIQRSCGYALRPTLSIAAIERAVRIIKQQSPECIVAVDNCYGEFTEDREPCAVSLDHCLRHWKVFKLLDAAFDHEHVHTIMRSRSVCVGACFIDKQRSNESAVKDCTLTTTEGSVFLTQDICPRSQVGADLVMGSLIKSPGGTIVPGGGYIAGRADLVAAAAARLTAPGVGTDAGGVSGSTLRLMAQGATPKTSHLCFHVFVNPVLCPFLQYTIFPYDQALSPKLVPIVYSGSFTWSDRGAKQWVLGSEWSRKTLPSLRQQITCISGDRGI